MNQDIGIVRNVGIGTSHHTEDAGDQYMEETGSESMQSVRSQVKVVIQAARREANQIYVDETQKYRTPRGERTDIRDRTRTLMLSAQDSGRDLRIKQHEKQLKTGMQTKYETLPPPNRS